ncbi:MAG: response regulator [Syntrophales bacterium]|nr:response regulator [Syntrophales bacterium]
MKPIRILYVDDNPLDRELVKDALEHEHDGFQVTEASSREEFEARLAEGGFDLVLSDFDILGFEGLQVIEAVKAGNPDLPVVIVTGTGSEEIAVRAIHSGAADYIIKSPKHIQRLPFTIRRVLEKLRLQAEKARAEADLREALQAWEEIFQAIGHPTFIMDTEHNILAANRATLAATGLTAAEILNRKCYEIFHRSPQPPPDCPMQRLLASGRMETAEMEVELLKGFYLVSCTPLVDAQGNLKKVIHIATDITARKRAEEAFQALVNQAPMGIYIVQDDMFQMVNPGFKQITGYTAEELLGSNRMALVAPDYQETVQKNATAMVKGELGAAYEFPIATKSGEIKWVMEKVTSTLYRGKPATMGYFLDISERKTLEGQLLQAQKMEAVGRLAGGVAHDFNNILGVIIGQAEIALMQVSSSEPLNQKLQEILKAALRAADLTGQLLAFARRQTVSPLLVDLNDSVSAMLKMLQRLIGEDIDLAWMPGYYLWKVRIDPSQIDQILANLAVNARDAITGVGKVTIETDNVVFDETYCSIHADFIPGEYVLLSVSDNGRGMDRETLAQIFEPFFTTKGVGEGTGLGLATVYGIVKQNEGFINVYSEPGHGTTLKIYLPRCRDEAPLARPETEAKPLQRGSETVLLVEDEEAILDTGKAILEHLGYAVLTAGTPGDALRLVEEYLGEIHLLISDVVMPEMNGRELVERITALKPGLKCLYISGYTTSVIAHRGVLDQGVNFIQKPFSLKALASKVREVLGS